jgi:hypothetical protein
MQSKPEATSEAMATAGAESAEIFRNRKFLVLDHGKLGVEIKFRIMAADGPTDGAKWFTDGAGDQIREYIQREAPGGVARPDINGLGLVSRLTRRIDLGDQTEMLPLEPRM